MIKDKQDLKKYKKKDFENGNYKNDILSYLTNDIWRFLRLLRLYEYLLNTKKGLLWSLIKLIVKYRFSHISKKLGYSIPPNVFSEGLIMFAIF